MLKKILIVVAVLVAIVGVFLGYVAMQPGDFRIERSAKMNAPANVVFDQVNDFHNWEAWSPWAKGQWNGELSAETNFFSRAGIWPRSQTRN